MLNPSTKPSDPKSNTNGSERKLTAVEEEAVDEIPRSDSDASSQASELPEPKKHSDRHISSASYKKSGHLPKEVSMRVSSSKTPRTNRDQSFGSRIEKVRDRLHNGSGKGENVVGARQITVEPERRKKKQVVEVQRVDRRKDKDRRSASGNVMRGL